MAEHLVSTSSRYGGRELLPLGQSSSRRFFTSKTVEVGSNSLTYSDEPGATTNKNRIGHIRYREFERVAFYLVQFRETFMGQFAQGPGAGA